MGMPADLAGGLPAKTDTQVEIPGTGTALDLSDLSPQIAAELASGLADADSICRQYGLTPEQWDRLRRNKAFRAMLAEALQVWRGELNAGQRITKKAEIVLEEAVPILDGMIHNPQLHPDTRLNAIKQVESLTGRKAKEQGAAGVPGGFALNINIGAGRERVTIEGKVVEPSNE